MFKYVNVIRYSQPSRYWQFGSLFLHIKTLFSSIQDKCIANCYIESMCLVLGQISLLLANCLCFVFHASNPQVRVGEHLRVV